MNQNYSNSPRTSKLLNLGLDSGYLSCRKLFIHQIHQDIQLQEISPSTFHFIYLNRPISKIEIVGVIRSIKYQSKHTQLICDDSTGTLVCTYFHDSIDIETFMKTFTIGDVVNIKGYLMKYEPTNSLPYDYAIKVHGMDKLIDPNLELFHWANTMYLHQVGDSSSSVNNDSDNDIIA